MIKISIPVNPPEPETWELILRRTTPEPTGYNQFAAQLQAQPQYTYPMRAVTVDDLIQVILGLDETDMAKIWKTAFPRPPVTDK